MTVRVRFAPSPTGYLHIGGARTALYCYLFAKANKGTFVLRIEDTDQARSKREFEIAQIADLNWLGIKYDEGPDVGGAFGPYRQSERLNIYSDTAQSLTDRNLAYHCFCSEEELQLKKEKAEREGRPPHYDGTCKNLSVEEVTNRLAVGETAAIRFKAYHKSYVFHDRVRGRIVFPEGMVGDFVILRSGGVPVYNFCCVVDDWKMQISHVIRAEEHLPNTLRQLMIYEAFDVTPPEFAHVSLLVGNDRQKLSKRHGATAVTHYREQNYLPQAICNYLTLLGWSHPEEKDIFKMTELESCFNLDRFSKAPALYDEVKLRWVNGQHLRQLTDEEFLEGAKSSLRLDHPFHAQSPLWQQRCIKLFKEQVELFQDLEKRLTIVFDPGLEEDDAFKDILSWPSTPEIFKYLKSQIESLVDATFVDDLTFERWNNELKKQGIKGKQLFMGLRLCCTGRGHGPELKTLVTLIPLDIMRARMQKLQEML